MIALAKVLRPHGVRGAVAVSLLTSGPQRLEEVGTVWLGRHDADTTARAYRVRRVSTVGRRVVVEMEGFSCSDAEAARGYVLMVPDEAAAPLPEGEYYHHEIVGCAVVDEHGTYLGSVREVLEMPAQDVYVVSREDVTWWLPAAKALITRIDVPAKRISIRALDGLLETGPAR